MDPFTHGIVGATAALSITKRWAKEASLTVRLVAMGCGVLAAELPDADRVIDHYVKPYGDDGQGLAYMLYHRGPTHTVLACLLFTVLVAALATALLRKTSVFWLFCAAAFAGVGLHLGMDGMNDYGVHPFPPLTQRWFYGDFLFLAEPTVSAALLPCLLVLLGLPKRWIVGVSVAVGVAAVSTLLILEQWLRPFGATVTVAWLLVQALAQRKQLRMSFAWLSLLGVLSTFALGSHCARAHVADWARARKLTPLADVATTPAPADPLCWRFITLTRQGDSFEEHLGVVDLSPWSRAQKCFSPPGGATPQSVCLPHGDEAAAQKMHEFAAFSGSFAEFERFAKADLHVDATRHFLRLPFWGRDARHEPCAPVGMAKLQQAASEPRQLIGDLRVDYDKLDLGTFCKYTFPTPSAQPPYRQLMPVGSPPLLERPVSARH